MSDAPLSSNPLVQRLRSKALNAGLTNTQVALHADAADEIERTEACFQGVMKDNRDLAAEIKRLQAGWPIGVFAMEKEIERLRAGLERIVKTSEHYHLGAMYSADRHLDAIRTARNVLSGDADETSEYCPVHRSLLPCIFCAPDEESRAKILNLGGSK